MHTARGLYAVAALALFALPSASADPFAKAPLGPGPQAPQAQTAPGHAAATPHADDTQMLTPIQVDSLTLTPIVANKPPANAGDLLVLDEAMPKKLVRIKEVDDGDVNNLTLSNTANQPLFLLAGEVIIGGKQDRIIGRNTIVPAKTTQQVPVFCVEHGRWTAQTKEFSTAKSLAHGRLRDKASFDGQQDVWDEVHAKNAARKTSNDTDTYRKIAVESDAAIGKMHDRVDHELAKLPAEQRARLVGFAVAVNGKVANVDVFQSPALLAKLQHKLVGSYVTEAIDVKAAKDAKPPTSADVAAFMADADKAAEEQSYETAAASTMVKKGAHADQAKVMLPAKRAPASPTAAATPAPAPTAVFTTYGAK